MFDPSRFLTADGKLDKNVPDPIEAFGYGRRICPGRYFALDMLFLTVVNILAVFRVEKAVDEEANVIEPSLLFSSGMLRYATSPLCSDNMFSIRSLLSSIPSSFKAQFVQRFVGVEGLIEASSWSE